MLSLAILGVLGVLISVVHAEFYPTYPNIETCVGLPVQYSCENTTVVKIRAVMSYRAGSSYRHSTGTHILVSSPMISCFQKAAGVFMAYCQLTATGNTFGQYCDLSRQYDPKPSPSTLPNGTVITPYNGPSVRNFIHEFGRSDLLHYMDTFWINQGAPNEELWAREFSKHGTCTSTFDVACYEPGYKTHQEVVNFFETVVKVFQMYPTYDMLAAAGIVPSNTTTYTRAQIANALYSQTGADPWLGCYDANGAVLEEIWYFHHVLGTEQYGHFKTLDSIIPSTCAETGIWYYERTPTSEKAVSH
ncbi:ribonuclease T2-like protein [Suillus subaureus]|uniref:Ribonuclease T2-like protein n=1 Tax=Suillus subaureus TaxID=48587 RepID=A0A9P7E797_9AGAM|nr:ribonuclease T2-like protein [Suillus subaureus]KAG1813257.1 ribonuclease T2-like protein [Suillus subaureus]